MIHPLADQGEGKAASFVAREFSLDAVRGDEVLRISALGLYRAFINGKRVGDDLLTPGWTCYDKRIAFQSYPVADLLRPGANRVEILARRRLVSLADHVARRGDLQLLGRPDRRAGRDRLGRRACCCGPTAHGRAARCRSCGRASTSARSTTPGSRASRRPRASRCWSSTGACWWRRSAGPSGNWRRSRCGRAGPIATAARSTTSARTRPATCPSRCAGLPGRACLSSIRRSSTATGRSTIATTARQRRGSSTC